MTGGGRERDLRQKGERQAGRSERRKINPPKKVSVYGEYKFCRISPVP
jgi:hypothetical protein